MNFQRRNLKKGKAFSRVLFFNIIRSSVSIKLRKYGNKDIVYRQYDLRFIILYICLAIFEGCPEDGINSIFGQFCWFNFTLQVAETKKYYKNSRMTA
jgi:uncharacterized protein YlbG (UPF0298 family)